MKTADFLHKHDASIEYVEWATSTSQDMSVVWDELISQARRDWLIWTATNPGVFPDSILRKLACRFVRETPLVDGRTVWDLLTDERSRNAVEVAERYADGKATKKELADAARAADAADAAYDAACDACDADDAWASYDSADVAARRTARYAALAARYASDADDDAYAAAWAALAAAYAAANAAADAAQIRMVTELGNPFKEGKTE